MYVDFFLVEKEEPVPENGSSNGITSTFHLTNRIPNEKKEEKLEFIRCMAFENLIGLNKVHEIQQQFQELWKYTDQDEKIDKDPIKPVYLDESFCSCINLYFIIFMTLIFPFFGTLIAIFLIAIPNVASARISNETTKDIYKKKKLYLRCQQRKKRFSNCIKELGTPQYAFKITSNYLLVEIINNAMPNNNNNMNLNNNMNVYNNLNYHPQPNYEPNAPLQSQGF